MDRQYTLCVLVPAQQYRSYIDTYNQTYAQQFQLYHQSQQYKYNQTRQLQYHQNLQQHHYLYQYQYQQQQQQQTQPEQIYENVVSQYHMRLSYHNDYENEEQIQRFYWEQCYRHDENDATAYYYCEYVGFFFFLVFSVFSILFVRIMLLLLLLLFVIVGYPNLNVRNTVHHLVMFIIFLCYLFLISCVFFLKYVNIWSTSH